MKKVCVTGILIALVSCLLPLAYVSDAGAQSATAEDILCSSSVEVDFPLTLRFKISAESSYDITDIRLRYSTNIESFAPITSEAFIKFEPDTDVDTEWSWDMRKTGGLPPGTTIKYRWILKDAGGNSVETEAARIRFEDDRYDWQTVTEGNLTIHWYEGNQLFTSELMASAQDALKRLQQNTGAYLKKEAEIYIYADSSDLQGAMVFPQEWTGGVAFTNYYTIAIGIAPYNIDWGKGAMTHELTHLVVHQMVLNPYIGLPTWLDEGLAMYNEGSLDVGFTSRLKDAVDENRLITVRSLSSPFSTDTETAFLSYAQSYSLVEYLITTYGQEKMLELLMTFSQGSSYDEALGSVYDFDTQELNSLWLDYISNQYRLETTETVAIMR